MISAYFLVLGLFFGSFLNVCIARLPLGESVVAPRSRCPRCRTQISWYDNVPVVSYLLLRGRCRACGQPISPRYPAVEVLNGLCYFWTAREFGLNGEALLLMAFCSSLIVITFIDLDHQIIPDVITLPGMLVGLAAAPFFLSPLAEPLPRFLGRFLGSDATYLSALCQSALGLLAGASPLFLIGWLWEKVRHVEAMGGGDIKLMGMVGSFLGWKGAFLTIMIGALGGSLVGGALILAGKHEADRVIPFGPFLAVGAAVSAFYGPGLIAWYLGLLHP